MCFNYSVYYRDVSVIGVEDDNVTGIDGTSGLIEEEDVPSVEGWFHAATEDDYYGGFAVGVEDEGFPDDEGGRDYEA